MMPVASGSKGFILHGRRYRENSRILELFTEEHGRVAVVARIPAGKRITAASKYQPFRELTLSWQGKSELQTLLLADELQPYRLTAEASLCGLYCNELIMMLVDKFYPLPALYHAYQATLDSFARNSGLEPALREFELALLEELGYGFALDTDAVSNDCYYHPLTGFSPERSAHGSLSISSDVIETLQQRDFSRQHTAKAVKLLFGMTIDHLLDGRQLKSRQLYRDMVKINS